MGVPAIKNMTEYEIAKEKWENGEVLTPKEAFMVIIDSELPDNFSLEELDNEPQE